MLSRVPHRRGRPQLTALLLVTLAPFVATGPARAQSTPEKRPLEIADYALPDPGEQARSEAIASLRVVLESLEAMLHAPT